MNTSTAKNSPRLRRLAAMEFRPPISWIASVAMLALNVTAFAATPVDIFQDMESGKDGDLLTPAIMNASSHGGGSKWSINGRMWVSTRNSSNLPGPVIAEGVTYSGAGGTRSWMFNDNNQLNYVKCTLPGRYPKITVACYYATGVTIPWVKFDSINFHRCYRKNLGRPPSGNGG